VENKEFLFEVKEESSENYHRDAVSLVLLLGD